MSIGEADKVFAEIDGMLTEVFTVRQTAYHLKYSERTIRQWCDEGKMVCCKIGNAIYIAKHSINRHKWRDSKPPYVSI